MKVLNYKDLNAQEIADASFAMRKEFIDSECNKMHTPERVKFTVAHWMERNPEYTKTPKARKLFKQLNAVLAQMGDPNALSWTNIMIHKELKAAKKAGDEEAIKAAEEEMAFWNTVEHLYMEQKGEDIHLGFNLLRGIGCDKDVDRALSIYERDYFDKYDTLNEEKRARLMDARDGKLERQFSATRVRLLDALISGNRELFSQLMYQAVEQDELSEIESVWTMMLIAERLK